MIFDEQVVVNETVNECVKPPIGMREAQGWARHVVVVMFEYLLKFNFDTTFCGVEGDVLPSTPHFVVSE